MFATVHLLQLVGIKRAFGGDVMSGLLDGYFQLQVNVVRRFGDVRKLLRMLRALAALQSLVSYLKSDVTQSRNEPLLTVTPYDVEMSLIRRLEAN